MSESTIARINEVVAAAVHHRDHQSRNQPTNNTILFNLIYTLAELVAEIARES